MRPGRAPSANRVRRRGAGGVTVAAFVALIASFPVAAGAEDNGVGKTPAMGWSSWSFVRKAPTAVVIEAQALALKSSGLARVGYEYVNLDDFWYECPGPQGPNVDQYGRWVIDSTAFPPEGAKNGIEVVADYVHSLGLKFGIYVTPGISKQAVAQNTAVEGTTFHASDIATQYQEANYNCQGMVGLDFSSPGAQAFLDSWASELASWGVDYVKLDGVESQDLADIRGWSFALRKTGRPIHLELSNNLNPSDAQFLAKYSNGWRTGNDIECYRCEAPGTSFPLTDWDDLWIRFNQAASWQPYGGPGGFNDYDSIEVGNGDDDGLLPMERQTQLSLWALASSPLILGTDLTHLDPKDLDYLTNTDVIAVDQDGIDAARIINHGNEQVFAKTESNGNVIVGLFDTALRRESILVHASAVGLPQRSSYSVYDIWNHTSRASGPVISADVIPHGVALLRLSSP